METYNGWTNYPTWRINLEFGFSDNDMFEDYADYEADDLADVIKEYVEEHLESESNSDSMVLSYALAFISDVNWHEIAAHILEDLHS